MKKTFQEYLDTPIFTEDIYRPRFMADVDALYCKLTAGGGSKKSAARTKLKNLQKRNERQWGIAEESLKALFVQENELFEPDVVALIARTQGALAKARAAKMGGYNMFVRYGKRGSRNPVGNIYLTLRHRYRALGKSRRARLTLAHFCERWLIRYWKLQGRVLNDQQKAILVDRLEYQRTNIGKTLRRRAISKGSTFEAPKVPKVRPVAKLNLDK